MPLATALLFGFLVTAQQPPARPTVLGGPPSQPPPGDCAQAMSRGMTAATTELCLGEEQLRLGEALKPGDPARTQHLTRAVPHYRKAANATADTDTKVRALDALARLYDKEHLTDLAQAELVLRELVSIRPNEMGPLFKLAKVQEDGGLIDAAESTFLSARQRHPTEVEPNRELAQFYARRVTAMHLAKMREQPAAPAPPPGEPDENGVYRVGGPVRPPPKTADVAPVYPTLANAAGLNGIVIVEAIVDETGRVRDAKVLRSIPLLDEAALAAVRQWQYAPTIIDGRAVPVKMTVTVNFSQAKPK